jgi:hypothetical protein
VRTPKTSANIYSNGQWNDLVLLTHGIDWSITRCLEDHAPAGRLQQALRSPYRLVRLPRYENSAHEPSALSCRDTVRRLHRTVTEPRDLAQGDRLYIGPGAGDRVVSLDRHLTTRQVSPAIRPVLAQTVERLIRHNQQQFIEYYNAIRLTDRDEHPLALLPGLSPDCRAELIAARRQCRFTAVTDHIEDGYTDPLDIAHIERDA